MGFLAGIGAKVWGYVIAAAAVLAAVATIFQKGKSAGRVEVTSKVNEETAKANKAMLDAAVNAPTEKKGLTDALRDPNRGL